MSDTKAQYVTLDLMISGSRSKLYRLKRAGKIREPDFTVNGRGYYHRDKPLVPPDDDKPTTKQITT